MVVDSGDGSGNTTAPEDDPGFGNVGVRGVASAIYLGNRWALTAAHVGPGSVKFGAEEFQIIPSETSRIGNPDGLSSQTDLLLLRLANEPQLPSLRLPCGPRRLGAPLLLVGNGHDRDPETTYWAVEVGPDEDDDVWTEVSTEAESNRQGFKTLPDQTIRWGRGQTGNTDLTKETREGDVLTFTSSFAKSLDIPSLAQAVRGDSGGAVFEKEKGVWELVGLVYAIDPLENQPSATRSAVYGATTLIADLYRYRELVLAVADFEPEPVDLNGDGSIAPNEIDALLAVQDLGDFASCHYDVDGNGIVDSLDFRTLIASPKILDGDADLDGEVGFSDFLILSAAFGGDAVGWSNGDFDGDGRVAFSDFLRLGSQFGQKLSILPEIEGAGSAAGPLQTGELSRSSRVGPTNGVASVPEPNSGQLLLVIMAACWLRRRCPVCQNTSSRSSIG